MNKKQEEKWSNELGLIRATIAWTMFVFSYIPDPEKISSLVDKVMVEIKKDIEKIVRKEKKHERN